MKQYLAYLDPQYYTSVLYQLCFVGVTCVALALFLYKPFVEFHPVGPSPHVTPVTSQVLADWKKEPVHVQVGLHITDFLRFDIVKNDFIINAFIWFAFDPKKISLEALEDFGFTKGEIIQKSKARVSQQQDTTIAQYAIRVQFATILDYERFPLDDHRIFLNLTHPSLTADMVMYESSPENYSISQNMYLSGWQLQGHTVTAGYSSIPLGKDMTVLQPRAIFALDISKQDMRQLALILFPLLFLFYLGILAFSIRDMTVNITLPIASISGLLAYSFVIQTLAPAVGYFMLSDYLFLFFLLSSFITFFVEALSAIPERILSKVTLERIEGTTIFLLHVGLVAVMYYLTDVKGL